jgi:hypothetical protein
MSRSFERIGKNMNLSEEEFVNKILSLKRESGYKFIPRQALVYTQDELQRSLASWHRISIPDEMINITFNRDFYGEKQKDIIKMINMFRDHGNLTICCVPSFQNIDTQIKNLTKMKLTVKKRGVAIIHTPNAVVYCKDKWDTATNEKIEREWIIKKVSHPNYSKLTTFRGLIKFAPLSKSQEEMYQEIKNEKRSVVLKNDMKIKLTDDSDPYQKTLKRLIDGGIRNGTYLAGIAMSLNMTEETLRRKLSRDLEKMGKPPAVAHYYWDTKTKEKEKQENASALDGL